MKIYSLVDGIFCIYVEKRVAFSGALRYNSIIEHQNVVAFSKLSELKQSALQILL